jgi:hypothetical protein
VRQDNTRLWKLQRVLELRSRRLGGSGRKGETSSAVAFNGARRSTVCLRESEPTAFISVREVVRAFLRVKEGKSRHGHKAARPANGRRRRGRPAHAGAVRGTGQRAR